MYHEMSSTPKLFPHPKIMTRSGGIATIQQKSESYATKQQFRHTTSHYNLLHIPITWLIVLGDSPKKTDKGSRGGNHT
jgi:hypothetical protein